MITFTTGDIFDADSDALVNPVNCVGVMGRGLALQFKKAWPENFEAYAAACRRGDLQGARLQDIEPGSPGRCRSAGLEEGARDRDG